MNDFLQSLRGGQKDKRAPKTRRGVDNNSTPHYNQTPNYPSGGYQNPRPGNVKRVTRSNSPAKYPGQDIEMPVGNDDFMEKALDVLDGFLKNQERLVDIQQRRILIEERKADALEELVAHFQLNPQPGALMEGVLVSADEGVPGALMEGASVPGDEGVPGERASAEIMERDFYGKVDVEDTPPSHLNSQGDRDSAQQQERGMDTPSYGNERLVLEQPAQVDGDLFSPASPSTARGKQMPRVKDSRKNVEHSVVRAKKRVTRSNEKNEIKKEVKVIKRSRADKAKAEQAKADQVKADQARADQAKTDKGQIKTDEPKVVKVVESPPIEGLLPREEVMHIIESMREKGATFDQVATYLVSIHQPTFSGRGEWHAQTVHRLCNRKK